MEESSAFSPTALIGAGMAGGAAVLAASAILGRSKDVQDGAETKTEDAPLANGDGGSETHQDKAFPSVEIPDENAK